MNKFAKRVKKCSNHSGNALIVGTGYGQLENILKIYKTVFVVSPEPPEIRAKNLVYRQNFGNLNQLTEINTIFLDRNKIGVISELSMLWQRNDSVVLIEGEDHIDRSDAGPFYSSGWACTSKQGFFHVWEKLK